MMEYVIAVFVGALIGTLDYLLKGTVVWKDLPKLFQGMSWHSTMAGLYFVVVFFYAYSHDQWIFLVAWLGIINEDFFFWIIRWAVEDRISFIPVFKWLTLRMYIFILVACNITMFFAFNLT